MNPRKDLTADTTADTSNDRTPAQFSLPSHQRRFLTEHNSCAMCDTKLEIRHEINMDELKVKEEAHCPSCGIRVRSSQHLMH